MSITFLNWWSRAYEVGCLVFRMEFLFLLREIYRHFVDDALSWFDEISLLYRENFFSHAFSSLVTHEMFWRTSVLRWFLGRTVSGEQENRSAKSAREWLVLFSRFQKNGRKVGNSFELETDYFGISLEFKIRPQNTIGCSRRNIVTSIRFPCNWSSS